MTVATLIYYGKTSSCSRVHGYVIYLPWTSAFLSGFPGTEVGMAAISSGTVSAAESVPGPVAPPDPMPNKDLGGLDDRELLDIVRVSPQASAPDGGVRAAGQPPPEPGVVLRATVPEQP